MAEQRALKSPGSFFGETFKPKKEGLLAVRFVIPPFSVLDARAGYWQERKRAWLALGIQSELGRGTQILYEAEQITEPGLNYYRNRKDNSPGGSPRPAMNYKNKERGDGAGKPMKPRMALNGLLNPSQGDVKKDMLKLRDRQKMANKGLPDVNTVGEPADGLVKSRGKGKGTYNDRDWIKAKGLKGLAQDTHVTAAKKADALTFGSGGPGTLGAQYKGKKAIPGGGTGKNSAYMFRKADGSYQAFGELPPDELTATGTSIFDPVLCECAYKWFSPQGGAVLDPFAGGSVRGILANYLGRHYTGVDLREEQVQANRIQGAKIVPDNQPEWIAGDSLDVLPVLEKAGCSYDLVFSCPPYADLEVYSDNPLDLSTMEYPDFVEAYRKIIKHSCDLLKPNRFAVFVVGEVRGNFGPYRGFVPDTIQAFKDAGLDYYNEAVLLTAVGSLPIRVGKQFVHSRKLGRTHQNFLVFVKGSPRDAAVACTRKRLNDFSDTPLLPRPRKRNHRGEKETGSLKGGLTFGTSIHAYDEYGQRKNEGKA